MRTCFLLRRALYLNEVQKVPFCRRWLVLFAKYLYDQAGLGITSDEQLVAQQTENTL